jgi:hypothetical protein
MTTSYTDSLLEGDIRGSQGKILCHNILSGLADRRMLR